MKANDLRIGNWVKYEDKLVQVVQLSSLMILCQRDENQFLVNCAPKVFDPIELTEEVLLKIGFKKNKYDWWKYFPGRENEISILMTDNYTIIEYANLFHCPEDVTEVNYNSRLEFPRRIYIHELQNAYFLISNQEMEIEL